MLDRTNMRGRKATGATWPDMIIAVVEFARYDTLRFIFVIVIGSLILNYLFDSHCFSAMALCQMLTETRVSHHGG